MMARRMGMVIRLRPEQAERYRALHADPWPEMDAALKTARISDYSIFLREPEGLLFGVWTYHGADFEADMAALGAREVTRRWLAETDPCQAPLESAAAGEWWAPMEEIYRLD